MKPRKNEQLTSRITEILSDALSREVSDPRLDEVGITRVELSSDGAFARVYVSSYTGNDMEVSEVLKVLRRASGFLRKHLAGRLQVRTVPELRFLWDDSVKKGEKVLSLLRKIEGPSD